MCPGDRNKQTVVAGTLQKWTKSEDALARAKGNKRMNVLLFRFVVVNEVDRMCQPKYQ